MYKKSNIKYGKLPAKVAEEIPWNKFFVDLINHMDLKNTHVVVKREINKIYP